MIRQGGSCSVLRLKSCGLKVVVYLQLEVRIMSPKR